MKKIVVRDGLSANAPHNKDLKALDLRHQLSAQPGGHVFLFDFVDAATHREEITGFFPPDENHCFRFLNGSPLTQASQG